MDPGQKLSNVDPLSLFAQARPDSPRWIADPDPSIGKLAIFANCVILAIDQYGQKEEPMPTRNINLTEHFDQFVEELVGAGRYKNASEVLRAGLRLLEQQTQTDEEKLTLLKKLAADGFGSLDQGQGLSVESESELRSTIAKIGRRAAKAKKVPETK